MGATGGPVLLRRAGLDTLPPLPSPPEAGSPNDVSSLLWLRQGRTWGRRGRSDNGSPATQPAAILAAFGGRTCPELPPPMALSPLRPEIPPPIILWHSFSRSVCIRGERRCNFASPLSWKAICLFCWRICLAPPVVNGKAKLHLPTLLDSTDPVWFPQIG